MKKVILSPTAKKRLEELFSYLENEFSNKTKEDFILNLEKIIQRINKYPQSFPPSRKYKSIRRCIIKQHTVMYYRTGKDKIEILAFFDNRQNPDKSPY